jgi:hypothetical protein
VIPNYNPTVVHASDSSGSDLESLSEDLLPPPSDFFDYQNDGIKTVSSLSPAYTSKLVLSPSVSDHTSPAPNARNHVTSPSPSNHGTLPSLSNIAGVQAAQSVAVFSAKKTLSSRSAGKVVVSPSGVKTMS